MNGGLSFVRFYTRKLVQAAPASFVACCIAGLALLLALASVALGTQHLAQHRLELTELRSKARTPVSTPYTPASLAPNLPWFDNAKLVEQLGKVAGENNLPIDEVGYVLEDGTQHPYLRYRITLSVTAAYPAIRQFADDVSSSLPHVDLDSISCTRSDIAVVAPTCELAFSAFFRKDAHAK
ncbi:hypothetical protein GTP58_06405 [Duganella sp. CY15W]|uniref:hypothetical protein n=1 Tax=Duganella sp. CY15W TaxID=2692172 RepID=UPI001367A206|nr:hypothetical protein [Duganella sp. CY15W]MYM27949.1 hypothetical protein [Duganella sp. CY15W]